MNTFYIICITVFILLLYLYIQGLLDNINTILQRKKNIEIISNKNKCNIITDHNLTNNNYPFTNNGIKTSHQSIEILLFR